MDEELRKQIEQAIKNDTDKERFLSELRKKNKDDELENERFLLEGFDLHQ